MIGTAIGTDTGPPSERGEAADIRLSFAGVKGGGKVDHIAGSLVVAPCNPDCRDWAQNR